jgi:hypothetical protein
VVADPAAALVIAAVALMRRGGDAGAERDRELDEVPAVTKMREQLRAPPELEPGHERGA